MTKFELSRSFKLKKRARIQLLSKILVTQNIQPHLSSSEATTMYFIDCNFGIYAIKFQLNPSLSYGEKLESKQSDSITTILKKYVHPPHVLTTLETYQRKISSRNFMTKSYHYFVLRVLVTVTRFSG